MRHPPLDRLRAASLACVGALTLAGCVKPLGSVGGLQSEQPTPATTTMPLAGTDAHVRFRLDPICSLEYDGFALPLVSPDGQWAAIQATSTADWPTLLGSLEGGQPNAGTISVAALSVGSKSPPVRVNATDLLLGRSADSAGFLVESPRVDGARWVGRVAWRGGDPVWLIEDEHVNAMATLGEGDSIAWCRRSRGNSRFALCVQQAGVTQEIPPPEDGSWMAPLFSGDGKYLYALRLRDGVLAACAFPISQAMSTVPTIAVDLSWRADERMAYQTLVPLRTGGLPDDARLWFFHPRFGRMACWNPLNNRIGLASPQSAGAAMIAGGRLVTASQEHLCVEPMPTEGSATETKRTSNILDALWIPIWSGGPSTLLVAHPHDGRLDVARIELDLGSAQPPPK